MNHRGAETQRKPIIIVKESLCISVFMMKGMIYAEN